MTAVRDFVGSNCPSCHHDILQLAPSTNRMPGEDKAWCPSCDARFSAEDLSRGQKTGLLKRLFGGRPSHA